MNCITRPLDYTSVYSFPLKQASSHHAWLHFLSALHNRSVGTRVAILPRASWLLEPSAPVEPAAATAALLPMALRVGHQMENAT